MNNHSNIVTVQLKEWWLLTLFELKLQILLVSPVSVKDSPYHKHQYQNYRNHTGGGCNDDDLAAVCFGCTRKSTSEEEAG
jgi:hypothetical protein